MSDSTVPAMLGRLSHDVILICNRQGVVREANPVALRLLGDHIVDHSLEELFSEITGSKGQAFLEHLWKLETGDISTTWELFFTIPNVHEPAPINIRGGIVDHETVLLVGACEPPQLTAIYHEVLAINSELTNLIRQLSKEQARLSARLERLLREQE